MIRLLVFLLLATLASLANAAPLAMVYYDYETNGDNKGTGVGFNAIVNSGSPDYGWTGGVVTRSDGTSVRPGGVSGAGVNVVDIDQDRVVSPIGTASLGNSFSISTWFYLSPNLISPGNGNASQRFFVFEAANNFDVSFGTPSTAAFATSHNYVSYIGEVPASTGFASTSLPINQWHHVVQSITSNGTISTSTVYIDGVNRGSASAATSTVNWTNLMIGAPRPSDDRDWDGVLDEFGAWNSALSAADAVEVYNKGVIGQPIQGVRFADGSISYTANQSITASGWTGMIQAPIAGPNNDLSDAGFDGHFMRTTATAGDHTLTIDYSNLDPHTHVNLGMLLAQLDSLDPVRDMDKFIVKVDGQTILDAGFSYGVSNDGSFTDGTGARVVTNPSNPALVAELLALRTLSNTNVYGLSNFNENVYDLSQLSLFHLIPHAGSTLKLEIIGRHNQTDEFYGIDNITLQLVTLETAPEPGSFSLILIASLIGLRHVRRRLAA